MRKNDKTAFFDAITIVTVEDSELNENNSPKHQDAENKTDRDYDNEYDFMSLCTIS